jgi:hypothetical protein
MWAQKPSDLEGTMAKPDAAGHKQAGYFGGILVTIGAAAILSDLVIWAHPIVHVLQSAKAGPFGLIPALGLSFLNAARAFTFHQFDYFSLVSRILVLFSALVAVVMGTTLWHGQQARAQASGRNNLPDSVEGDR